MLTADQIAHFISGEIKIAYNVLGGAGEGNTVTARFVPYDKEGWWMASIDGGLESKKWVRTERATRWAKMDDAKPAGFTKRGERLKRKAA